MEWRHIEVEGVAFSWGTQSAMVAIDHAPPHAVEALIIRREPDGPHFTRDFLPGVVITAEDAADAARMLLEHLRER